MECFSNSEHVKKQQNGRKMSTLDGSKFNSEFVSNLYKRSKHREITHQKLIETLSEI